MKRLTRIMGAAVLALWLAFIGGPAAIEIALSQKNTSSTYYSTKHTSVRTTPVAEIAAPVVSSLQHTAATQNPVQLKNDEVAAQNYKVEEKSGVVPFANFTVEVGVEQSGQLEVIGVLTLGATTNGADLLKEHLTLTIGTFFTTIPAGSFKTTKQGQLRFKKVVDCILWDVAFQTAGKNKFQFKAELDAEKKLLPVKPEHVALTIGDDSGHAKAYSK